MTMTGLCHCGRISLRLECPQSMLPLAIQTCRCTTCRHTLGTPVSVRALMPGSPAQVFLEPGAGHHNDAEHDKTGSQESWGKGLTSCVVVDDECSIAAGAETQHAPQQLNLYFCPTCGAHMAACGVRDDLWRVSVALFDSQTLHSMTQTNDINNLVDEILAWVQEGYTDNDCSDDSKDRTNALPDCLDVACHCGGVSFTLFRPTLTTTTTTGSEEAVLPEWPARFVCPDDARKWIACLDLCGDCRRVNGMPMIAWAFVPLSRIQGEGIHEVMESALRMQDSRSDAYPNTTLTTYASSSGVVRAFCSGCGATVFYGAERMVREGQAVLDLALGLVGQGGRSKDWFRWRAGRIAFLDSGRGFHGGLAAGLEGRLREWSVARYGVAPEYKVDKR